MSGSELIDRLRREVRHSAGLAAVLHAILDRREQRGATPKSITVTVEPGCIPLLRELFSARAVADRTGTTGDRDGRRVRLDLVPVTERLRAQSGLALCDLFYRVLDRRPRDPAAEEQALRAGLLRALGALSISATTGAAQRFLAAETAQARDRQGTLYALAHRRWQRGQPVSDAVARADREARHIVRCMDLALQNRAPVRLQNFAARALGDPKALIEGNDLHTRLCDALLAHDPDTAEEVASTGILTSTREARREALAAHSVFRDQSTITAYCFGPLVYRKSGHKFDHVAVHAALGECVPLCLQQLRDIEIAALPVERVVLIENETPFLDYVDALWQRRGGRASWSSAPAARATGPW